jgi:glycine hydroxymethyltransferase
MAALADRPWLPSAAAERIGPLAEAAARRSPEGNVARIADLVEVNRLIHERDCINLDPAANVMNPRAEAMLAAGLSSRPSLGHPGAKHGTGLEAVEEIEVIAAELAARVFNARHVEIRVPSGAMANLFAFMALARPGDAIIVPPASIGGHVTHHRTGCAGLYGLRVHEARVDPESFSIDVAALRSQALEVRPRVITLGGSINLFPHPVDAVRRVADEVGATVLVDAAHQCGLIAGGLWPDPLAAGAHLVSMSTYKSLGGPPGGLLLTNEPAVARRIEAIAHPGMTANYDAGRAAALAVTLCDWLAHGPAYARKMAALAGALAAALDREGLPVFATSRGATESHQFALAAARWGGGTAAARHLRRAGLLASGIGLPLPELEKDLNGLRLGTPEIARLGMEEADMAPLADLVARALGRDDPEALAAETRALRARFTGLRYILA